MESVLSEIMLASELLRHQGILILEDWFDDIFDGSSLVNLKIFSSCFLPADLLCVPFHQRFPVVVSFPPTPQVKHGFLLYLEDL